MSDEDTSDSTDGGRFEALREAVESESYLEEGGVNLEEGQTDSEGIQEESSEPEREDESDTSDPLEGEAASPGDTTTSAGSQGESSPPSADDSRSSPEEPTDPAEDTEIRSSGQGTATQTEPEATESVSASSTTSGESAGSPDEGQPPTREPGGRSTTAGPAETEGASDPPDAGSGTPWSSVDTPDRGDQEPDVDEDWHEVSSLLVLQSTEEMESDQVCSTLLCGGEASRNVVMVTFEDAPTERLSTLRDCVYESNEVVIVDIGDMASTAGTTEFDTEGWANVSVRPMTNPSDASRLGMVIDDVVTEWAEEPHDTRVCFHSLSGLLEYMDEETAFRFIHTLLRRFAAVDAAAHFHMDTEAQSIETLRTLQVLFDDVVSVSEDGELSSVEV
jgi:hypothetical protein